MIKVEFIEEKRYCPKTQCMELFTSVVLNCAEREDEDVRPE